MPTLREAEHRHAAHHLGVVHAADTLYKQGDADLEKALRMFNTNEANIRAGLEWAAQHSEEDENAAGICSDFPNIGALLFELLFAPVERFRWLEYAVEAARRLADEQAEGWHIGNTGLVHLHVGNIAAAIRCFEQVLPICRKFRDRTG